MHRGLLFCVITCFIFQKTALFNFFWPDLCYFCDTRNYHPVQDSLILPNNIDAL